MAFNFAKRTEGISGSAIREIFKLLADPEVISFAGGMPAAETFDREEIARIASGLIREKGDVVLQYGATEGWPDFLAAMKNYGAGLGIDMEREGNRGILPCTGSTQAIDLAFKVFLDPEDIVYVENPTFLSTLQQLAFYQSNIRGIPMDDEGMDIDALEAAVKKQRPKMVYVIPNFQNPTGASMGLNRRSRLAAMAREYDFILIEDDPYRDLRYVGEHLPTIKSFDEDGHVLYIGTFSKNISPGLRMAYAIGHPDIIRKMTIAKQSADVHTPNLNQAMVAQYLREGLLPLAVMKANKLHGNRMQRMIDCMHYLPKGSRYVPVEGGLFLWVVLPQGIDTLKIFPDIVAESKVAYLPGEHFFVSDKQRNTMRLNFSKCDEDTIERGMKALGEGISKFG